MAQHPTTVALRAKCVARGRGLVQMRADQVVDFLDEIAKLESLRADVLPALKIGRDLLAACKGLIIPWDGVSDEELLDLARTGGLRLPVDSILDARAAIDKAESQR